MTLTKKTSIVRSIRTALNFFYYFSILGIVFLSIFTIVKGISHEPKDGRFEATYYSSSPASLKVTFISNHAGNGEIIVGPGVISFKANRSFLIFTRSIQVIFFLIFFIIIYFLRQIFNDLVKNKSPFIPENPKRIRWIGYIIIAGSLISSVFDFMVGKYIAQNITLTDIGFSYGLNLNLPAIFLGLIIIVLAEIFRTGNQLKEDQELTV